MKPEELFIKENTRFNPLLSAVRSVSAQVLYSHYWGWMKEHHPEERPFTITKFKRQLEYWGMTSTRTRQGMRWRAIEYVGKEYPLVLPTTGDVQPIEMPEIYRGY